MSGMFFETHCSINNLFTYMPYSPGFPLVLENTAENTLMCPSYNVCFMRYSLHLFDNVSFLCHCCGSRVNV